VRNEVGVGGQNSGEITLNRIQQQLNFTVYLQFVLAH